ncbi:MAG: hypothetical protein J6Z36_03525 [Clostridia bacterium]|nr:hypothetical protein [Clostridia bacterium]
MNADLHFHSVYSDGAHTPEELATMSAMNGVTLAACTDHDNFDGDKEKRAAFEKKGVIYLTGVELSAYSEKLKVHITGYAYNSDSELCRKYQAERVKASYERLYDVLEKLKFYKNISLTEEEVLAQLAVKSSPVHTAHVVKALLAGGYYPDAAAAFKDCFMPWLPTYSFVGRVTPEEGIKTLHELGGIACIAHPGRIRLEHAEREKLICELKEMGADGIECTYTSHTERETQYFKGLADKLQLLKTGGSDFHRAGAGRELGFPRFEPSDELLEATHVRV